MQIAETLKIGGAILAGAIAWGSLNTQVSTTREDIAKLQANDARFQEQLLELRERQVATEIEQTRILAQMQTDIAYLKDHSSRKR